MTQETSPPSLDSPNSSLEHQTVGDASGPTGGLTSQTVGGNDSAPTGEEAPLNCPYCGGSASLFASSDHSTAWEGGCSNEACEVQPSVWKASKAEAIAAWNRRAAPGGQQHHVEGFLCRAWGETDLPEAALVRSREEWEAFVVTAQWGSDANYAALDEDDREMVDAQVRYIVADMADNGIGCMEFEIGGISVERVTFLAAAGVPSAGPWSVVALLREPGEPRARYSIQRTVWADGKPTSEYLPETFGPDAYGTACAHAQRLNQQASEAACRAALADLDPVVIEAWKVQGRTVGAMLKDRDDYIQELRQKLEDGGHQ